MRTFNHIDAFYDHGLNAWEDALVAVTRPNKSVVLFEYASPGPDYFMSVLGDVEEDLTAIMVVTYVVFGVSSFVVATIACDLLR